MQSIDKLKPWIHHIQKWSSVKLHREKKTGYTCVVNSSQGKLLEFHYNKTIQSTALALEVVMHDICLGGV